MSNGGPVAITEVVELCVRMRAVSLDLFAEVGAWVAITNPGPTQRWLSSACHRHAWHAELWAQRFPVIPLRDLDASVEALRARRLPGRPDGSAYRDLLTRMAHELDTLADRVDADLDPSTRRTVTLVGNDLADLLTA